MHIILLATGLGYLAFTLVRITVVIHIKIKRNMSIASVTNYHNELKNWEKTLFFYLDETRIFESRLTEVVNKNTGKAVLAEVEHFQNQFILQKQQFDVLKDEIHREESRIRNNAEAGEFNADEREPAMQPILQNRINAAEKIFEDTKKEFYRFLSKVF